MNMSSYMRRCWLTGQVWLTRLCCVVVPGYHRLRARVQSVDAVRLRLVEANAAHSSKLAKVSAQCAELTVQLAEFATQLSHAETARETAYTELVELRVRAEVAETTARDASAELIAVLKQQVDWHAILHSRRSVYGNESKVVGMDEPTDPTTAPIMQGNGKLAGRIRRQNNAAARRAFREVVAQMDDLMDADAAAGQDSRPTTSATTPPPTSAAPPAPATPSPAPTPAAPQESV